MFPFNERVHTEYFKEVLKKGKTVHFPYLSVCFLRRDDGQRMFSVVVGKKVSKLAVVRNRNKRRVRGILKKISQKLIPGSYIVFIKKDISKLEYAIIENLYVSNLSHFIL